MLLLLQLILPSSTKASSVWWILHFRDRLLSLLFLVWRGQVHATNQLNTRAAFRTHQHCQRNQRPSHVFIIHFGSGFFKWSPRLGASHSILDSLNWDEILFEQFPWAINKIYEISHLARPTCFANRSRFFKMETYLFPLHRRPTPQKSFVL